MGGRSIEKIWNRISKNFNIPTRRRDVEIPDRKLSDQLWLSQSAQEAQTLSVQKKRWYVFLRPTFIFASTFNAFLFSQKCVLPGFILKVISLFAVASQQQAPLHCLKQTSLDELLREEFTVSSTLLSVGLVKQSLYTPLRPLGGEEV
jgi:hypothetical protein